MQIFRWQYRLRLKLPWTKLPCHNCDGDAVDPPSTNNKHSPPTTPWLGFTECGYNTRVLYDDIRRGTITWYSLKRLSNDALAYIAHHKETPFEVFDAQQQSELAAKANREGAPQQDDTTTSQNYDKVRGEWAKVAGNAWQAEYLLELRLRNKLALLGVIGVIVAALVGGLIGGSL